MNPLVDVIAAATATSPVTIRVATTTSIPGVIDIGGATVTVHNWITNRPTTPGRRVVLLTQGGLAVAAALTEGEPQ